MSKWKKQEIDTGIESVKKVSKSGNSGSKSSRPSDFFQVNLYATFQQIQSQHQILGYTFCNLVEKRECVQAWDGIFKL